MRLIDSRRLTGPSLVQDEAGAVIEVELPEDGAAELVGNWRRQAQRLLAAVGWGEERTAVRHYDGGASLAISAPIDGLYAACEINEAAWATALASFGEAQPASYSLPQLQELVDAEANPALLALAEAAADHGLAFLCDDEVASVGLGSGSLAWPVDQLPAPDAVTWGQAHDVPVALVTGTNGKTTTVRMLAAIATEAGIHCGNTSTDGVQINGTTVLSGDYTGGEGARTLLRDTRVDLALVETARGGLLRRGLLVGRADVAYVSNVGTDHLGEYGVIDLDALAQVKLLVARAIRPGGVLLLNADDALLRRHAASAGVPVTWLTLDAEVPLVGAARRSGVAYVQQNGVLGRLQDGRFVALLETIAAPATLGGAARHNVYNALAAAAIADSIGLAASAIGAGLKGFRSDVEQNPGRGNYFEFGSLKAYADFAHNPEGLELVLQMGAVIPAERRLVILGQAGDRDDFSIDRLAEVTWRTRPERIVLKQMPDYLRGRVEGEVVERLRQRLLELGAPSDRIEVVASEIEAVRSALRWGRPGDLLMLLLHAQREEVLNMLQELDAAGWRPGETLPDSPVSPPPGA